MSDSINISKKSLRGFLVGVVIAAPIFIGGTYFFSDRTAEPNTYTDPNDNPPVVQQEPEFKIDNNTHFAGDKDADAQLIVYSDFECSFCARHHETIKELALKYQDEIFIAFKHFPLSFHQNAATAALAAECAGEQGEFWEYADMLFANQIKFASEPWLEFAQELGLDEDKFTGCMESEKYASKVQADLDEGFGNGVEGTPATFVNGELVPGALPLSNFEQIIDSLLK